MRKRGYGVNFIDNIQGIMNEDLISVIVPVYNVAQYLPRMMNKLTKQTYSNIEIILVDDGSADDSYNICKQYAKMFKYIFTYHKANGGAASARNYGFLKSQGKYITFVDADDWVSEDYIEYLYNLLHQNLVDISVCGYKKVYTIENINKDISEKDIKNLTSEEALEDLLYRRHLTNSPCLKLIKREIFQNAMFPEGMLYEDLAVVYRWFDLSNGVVYSPSVKYYYFQREGSSMHSAFNEKKWDRILISKKILEFIEEKYPSLIKAAESRMLISILQMIRELPMSRQYKEHRSELKYYLRKLRSRVLLDQKVSITTKVLALSAYLPYAVLKWMGLMSGWFIMHFRIVQKY